MKRYKTSTICEECGKKYKKETYDIKMTNHNLCSKKCTGVFQRKRIKTNCGCCFRPIEVNHRVLKYSKSGKAFCSQSCAATYNNKLRRKSRRTKIEIKFYNLRVKEFPNLDILPNDKTMLDGLEVDVAIPSLKLAIEWNGVVHFKPIYGQTKLDKIQNKDAKKLKIAANKNINLITITDLVSNNKILIKAFNQCKNIISKLLPEETGNDPVLP